jgi:hypothetical protein
LDKYNTQTCLSKYIEYNVTLHLMVALAPFIVNTHCSTIFCMIGLKSIHFIQSSSIICQLILYPTSSSQNGYMIIGWKNISLLQVVQGSLVILQHYFDITSHLQNDYIIGFNNINHVQVLQSSLVVLQQYFDSILSQQSDCIIAWETLLLSSCSRFLCNPPTIFWPHLTFAKWSHIWIEEHSSHSKLLRHPPI